MFPSGQNIRHLTPCALRGKFQSIPFPKRVSPWLRASDEMVAFWNYTTRGSPSATDSAPFINLTFQGFRTPKQGALRRFYFPDGLRRK